MAKFFPRYLQDSAQVKQDLLDIITQYLKKNFLDLARADGSWNATYHTNFWRLLPFTSGERGYYRALQLYEYLQKTSDGAAAEMMRHLYENSGGGELHGMLVNELCENIMDLEQERRELIGNIDLSPSAIITSHEQFQDKVVNKAIGNALEGSAIVSAPEVVVAATGTSPVVFHVTQNPSSVDNDPNAIEMRQIKNF